MSEAAAKRAVATEFRKKRVKRGEGEAGKAGHRRLAYHASHATAQKSIKKKLHIENKVDGDAYSAVGQCLDETLSAVVQRYIDMHGPRQGGDDQKWPTLTSQVAMSGLGSLIKDKDEHKRIFEFINNCLDSYHGVAEQ